MNVVYAVTKNYIDYIIPSIRSLLRYNPDVNVLIVTEASTVEGLPCDATIINISGQTAFPKNGVNYWNFYTYINLLKVCYPSLLDIDKVIHLDADTIICSSLEPLWNIDLTGKWFAACPEIQQFYRPFGERYYNMGIAVINLDQMRKDKIEPVMVRYLNDIKQPYADQDAWNKYGIEQDKIVPFDRRFNECDACGRTFDPAIIHYCGISSWWTDKSVCRHGYLEMYKDD